MVGLFACREKAKEPDPNVIATVNGEVLSRADFEAELARDVPPAEGGVVRTREQLEPTKRALLGSTLERMLLLQTARTLGIQVTPAEADRRVLAMGSEMSDEAFDTMLTQSGLTRSEFTRRTQEQLLIEKLFSKQVYDRLAVTEEAVRRTYEAQNEKFMEPERVHAAHIVVSQLDEARRLQQQLWNGKKFSDLARRHSISPDAKVGGDLGFFSKGQMPPAFEDVVFKMQVGQTSDVVSTDYGFHIFRLLERQAPRKRELPEVRERIEAMLLAGLKEEAQARFVKSLKDKAVIDINEAALASVSANALRTAAPAP